MNQYIFISQKINKLKTKENTLNKCNNYKFENNEN